MDLRQVMQIALLSKRESYFSQFAIASLTSSFICKR